MDDGSARAESRMLSQRAHLPRVARNFQVMNE